MTQIFWEANRCVDKLAKLGAVQLTDFLILYEPQPVVDNFLGYVWYTVIASVMK